jgi:hypothetical protein
MIQRCDDVQRSDPSACPPDRGDVDVGESVLLCGQFTLLTAQLPLERRSVGLGRALAIAAHGVARRNRKIVSSMLSAVRDGLGLWPGEAQPFGGEVAREARASHGGAMRLAGGDASMAC